MATSAPSRASTSAIPSPIPRAPPVTITVLPSSLPMHAFSDRARVAGG